MIKIILLYLFLFCQPKNSDSQSSEEPSSNIGIGPISTLNLSEDIDESLVEDGQTLFELNCSSCHLFDADYQGPKLANVTKRRSPEWIMNMILNPIEMAEKDTDAKLLKSKFAVQMVTQIDEIKDARAILEYLRQYDTATQSK